MSVAFVLIIVVVVFCAVLLSVMIGFDSLTYRRGRGGWLATGFFALILSGVRFYFAERASARHAAVSSLWYGEPITLHQEYCIAVSCLLFGVTCVALSLRRAERSGDTPNV